LDRRNYATGNQISKEHTAFVNLKPHRVLPRWNYAIIPHKRIRKTEKYFFGST